MWTESLIDTGLRKGEIRNTLCGQARSVDGCFLCVQITCPRNHELPELTGQDTGFTSPLFYFGGHVSCSVAWFVAQHACLVLW